MSIKNKKRAEIQGLLEKCNQICEKYSWLLNAYVSDFYVHNHWDTLPKSWRESLKDLELESIGNIIDSSKELQLSHVLPLSLLALRNSVKHLQIPRKLAESNNLTVDSHFLLDSNLHSIYRFRNAFWRRVKLKKKHEIELISKICYKSAIETNCHYIVDIGAGLGHLSRMLSYGYGLKVCSFETQEYLTNEARKLDQEMEDALLKCFGEVPSENLKPIHVNMDVNISSDGEDIMMAIKEAFGENNYDFQFGIVGLHPCGDLSATLLKLFKKISQVKFINIVGCCYMKLSESIGYPLSEFCTENNYNLSYSAREVACHALEAYVEKLQDGQYGQLKIHAYRAALEKLIVEEWPHLFHSQISSVKYCDDLTFSEYCLKAVAKLDIELSKSKMESKEIQNDILNWKRVVIFYSLRLMIAPLVETIILLDRLLFILESGKMVAWVIKTKPTSAEHKCDVTSVFDPKVSPRNQVLMGTK